MSQFLIVATVSFMVIYIFFLARNNFCTNFLYCDVDCEEGYKKSGLFCVKPCNADRKDVGLLCRDRCRDGYVENAGVCWQKCPDGYVNTGAFCQKGKCRTSWDKCKYRWPKWMGGGCRGALVTRCDKFHTMKKTSYVPKTTTQKMQPVGKALSPILKTFITYTIFMMAYIIFLILKLIHSWLAPVAPVLDLVAPNSNLKAFV